MAQSNAGDGPSPALTRDARPVMLRDAMQDACHPTLSDLRDKALAIATERQREAGRFLAVDTALENGAIFMYGVARGRVMGLDDALEVVKDGPSEAVQSARVLLAIEVQGAYDAAVWRSEQTAEQGYSDAEEDGLRTALTIIVGKGNRVDAEGVYTPCNVCGRKRPRPHAKSCASCWDDLLRVAPNRCTTCEKPLPANHVPSECFRCSDRRGDAEQDAIALHADGLL